MSNKRLKFNGVTIGYDNQTLIHNINLDLPANKLIGLVGENGSGKTTLFNTLLGNIPSLTGQITFNNQPIIEVEKIFSVVFTKRVSIQGFSGLDMLSMAKITNANWKGGISPDDKKEIISFAKTLVIENLLNKQINELSDGQYQKLMVAKAVLQDTPIILMDEPTAFLDIKNKKQINNLLLSLVKDQNKTIIVSTHDEIFCTQYCENLMVIKENTLTLTESNIGLQSIFE